jgi:hypothetical protein
MPLSGSHRLSASSLIPAQTSPWTAISAYSCVHWYYYRAKSCFPDKIFAPETPSSFLQFFVTFVLLRVFVLKFGCGSAAPSSFVANLCGARITWNPD